jgi:hypothetical protein
MVILVRPNMGTDKRIYANMDQKQGKGPFHETGNNHARRANDRTPESEQREGWGCVISGLIAGFLIYAAWILSLIALQ